MKKKEKVWRVRFNNKSYLFIGLSAPEVEEVEFPQNGAIIKEMAIDEVTGEVI